MNPPEHNQPEPEPNDEIIVKLTKDLKAAVLTMSPNEVRFLVDAYYQHQDNRIRAAGQVRSMAAEPHAVLEWLANKSEQIEGQIRAALDVYSKSTVVGRWSRSIKGIGPVIAAGLMANIDITKAPTVGHIWRFAGLDPTAKWIGRTDAENLVTDTMEQMAGAPLMEVMSVIAKKKNQPLERYLAMVKLFQEKDEAEQPKKKHLVAAAAMRPWSASLKVLCWKLGESFVKVSGYDDAYYGKLYTERKVAEAIKNQEGAYQAQAAEGAKRVGKTTEAYKFYSKGLLPPGHLHARAKRYAVKLLLAHWHEVAYKDHFKKDPPLPYPIAILGHAHKMDVPNKPGESDSTNATE